MRLPRSYLVARTRSPPLSPLLSTPLLPLALVFTSAQSVTSTLHHHLTPLNFYLYSTVRCPLLACHLLRAPAPLCPSHTSLTRIASSPPLAVSGRGKGGKGLGKGGAKRHRKIVGRPSRCASR